MKNYVCFRCGYKNYNLAKFKSHLNRKTSCDAIYGNMSMSTIYNIYVVNKDNDHIQKLQNDMKIRESVVKESDSNYYCKYCNKSFAHLSSKYKHEKNRCKKKNIVEIKNETIDNKAENIGNNEMMKIFDKKMKQLENTFKKDKIKMEKKFEKKIKELTRENNKNKQLLLMEKNSQEIEKKPQTIKIYPEIKLNAYDKTDKSHLKDEDYFEAIKRGNMGVPLLIEKIHFNPEKTDNFNIYMSNVKSEFVHIFDGEKWKLVMINDVLNYLIEDNLNDLEDKIEEWEENDHEYSKQKYKPTLDKFPRFMLRYSDSLYVSNKVRKEVKLLLFNNRDIPKNKKIENDKISVNNENNRINVYDEFIDKNNKFRKNIN